MPTYFSSIKISSEYQDLLAGSYLNKNEFISCLSKETKERGKKKEERKTMATSQLAANEQKFLTNKDSNDEVYEYVNEQGQFVSYDMDRLQFCETKPEIIPPPPGTDQKPMTNYRIMIQDKRADGKLQDFLIRTDDLFSFGVSESFDQKTGELNGYSFPMPMWDQEGATPIQKTFSDWLEITLLNKIKDHLVTNRKTFKQPDLQLTDLRKMKVFYRKKDEDGGVNVNDPPTWYPKLIVSKKKGMKIISRFYLMDSVDSEGQPIELIPDKLRKRMGRTKACVKIESLYVRSEGISLICKVWEADFKPVETSLSRKGKISKTAVVVSTDDNNPLTALMKACAENTDEPEPEPEPEHEHEKPAEILAAQGDITVTDGPVSNPLTVVPVIPPKPTPATGKKVVKIVKVVKKTT